ncbi:hypothetical protein DS742_28090 [Lacrimispora amygdalina]|uniref:Uncharacterized protein n=2 Tax=Lacrimispora amygdalina TaxID=253257 RepID=A0A3E2N3R9_9FIRM|nr:hypothetical protein DS742_28090 [Clostridium indicum]
MKTTVRWLWLRFRYRQVQDRVIHNKAISHQPGLSMNNTPVKKRKPHNCKIFRTSVEFRRS